MTPLQEKRIRDFLRFGNMSHETREAVMAALAEIETLRGAATKALHEMCHTIAPRNSFTDAVDALDAALHPKR